ncbi:hypothetical protein DPMN_025869 [Dreissena polymorpha]|uniref:Uncharacterized protein n=1 Tax=Dreissena polymorpha TaxID=45954 RepID=A0A9D4LSB5_DREPO|nr:hypothetical protein DPMN_025869 [Dreissena polymorpha]
MDLSLVACRVGAELMDIWEESVDRGEELSSLTDTDAHCHRYHFVKVYDQVLRIVC